MDPRKELVSVLEQKGGRMLQERQVVRVHQKLEQLRRMDLASVRELTAVQMVRFELQWKEHQMLGHSLFEMRRQKDYSGLEYLRRDSCWLLG